MLSGIQPTGVPHIGNYFGAIQNWAQLQNEYEYFIFIADLHALTVPQDPKVLEDNTLKLLAYLLACGLDPQKCVLFVQSHIPQHLQLAWFLNCIAYMGELNRMTQFKDKSKKADENLNAGLFTYPVLQAADILLYKPHFVPVGEDQRQHLELTRNLAERFNKRVKKKILRVPDPYISSEGAKIMDLQDPLSKMSKSTVNSNGIIFLDETDKSIVKKIKSAVTDSGKHVHAEKVSDGMKNLSQVYAILKGQNVESILEENEGKLYGHYKLEIAEALLSVLKPIREKAQEIIPDRTELQKILRVGTEKAAEVAEATLKEVSGAIGLLRQ